MDIYNRSVVTTKANPPPDVFQSTMPVTAGDIYYALFRNKWKIFLCVLLSLVLAIIFRVTRTLPFQSEAKLFIRYVVTPGKPIGLGRDDTIKPTDQTGDMIMDSELEILTSADLAKQVAEAVGPEKLLAKLGGGKDINNAAGFVRGGLSAEVMPRTTVVRIIFKHPDPSIVQQVLTEVVDRYQKNHIEIHRAVSLVNDFLTQETDQLRSRLAQTEEELRRAKNKVGILSIEEAKRSNVEQISRIRQEILASQADLVERSSMLQEISRQKLLSPEVSISETPAIFSDEAQKAVDHYKVILARVDFLRRKKQELLTQFTDESSRVKDIQTQIAGAEIIRKKLENDYPKLFNSTTLTNPIAPSTAMDVNTESARLIALQSKIRILKSQLEELRTEANTIDQLEVRVSDLRRRMELEEGNYRYYAATSEQARINEAIGNGRVSNISVIQTPSPLSVDSRKSDKTLMSIAFSGVIVGLLWAVLIEFYFDRTVRRPKDLERALQIPLFLSIPDFGRNKSWSRKHLSNINPVERTNDGPAVRAREQYSLPDWETITEFAPYNETLRDRLVGYFESQNLTHKPKLVAVTGLARQSGVTTVASGLAGALSETGDGNVLLVDLTPGQGSARQFYRGKAVCGLEEILAARNNAQIQENLFVVSGESSDDKLSRLLPQRFTKIVPILKASNFDYIIFDMPPVSQISITPRLAGFMDIVLLVIESEKTDQHLVEGATSLLRESNAHVGSVLNRARNYVPARLHQESLNNVL